MPNVHGIERRRRKELAAEKFLFLFLFLKEKKRTKPNKKKDEFDEIGKVSANYIIITK